MAGAAAASVAPWAWRPAEWTCNWGRVRCDPDGGHDPTRVAPELCEAEGESPSLVCMVRERPPQPYRPVRVLNRERHRRRGDRVGCFQLVSRPWSLGL